LARYATVKGCTHEAEEDGQRRKKYILRGWEGEGKERTKEKEREKEKEKNEKERKNDREKGREKDKKRD
jgi:hypothetical protein